MSAKIEARQPPTASAQMREDVTTIASGLVARKGDFVTILPSFPGDDPQFFDIVLPEHGLASAATCVSKEAFELAPGEAWPVCRHVPCPLCGSPCVCCPADGCHARGGFVCSREWCSGHSPGRCAADPPDPTESELAEEFFLRLWSRG